MKSLVLKKNDVPQWTIDDVSQWLNLACKMDQNLIQLFKRHCVDGYTLLQIKEYDLEMYMKIESLGHRKNIIRNINTLRNIWFKVNIINANSQGLDGEINNK